MKVFGKVGQLSFAPSAMPLGTAILSVSVFARTATFSFIVGYSEWVISRGLTLKSRVGFCVKSVMDWLLERTTLSV